jgi:hypothetical protein
LRPRLLQPLGERRHARRPVRRRANRKAARTSESAPARVHPEQGAGEPRTQMTGEPRTQMTGEPRTQMTGGGGVDVAVQRVREAGGPVDHACYACACGLLFQARVSTTVTCPHCGAGQAW